jgi:hypothetical protein
MKMQRRLRQRIVDEFTSASRKRMWKRAMSSELYHRRNCDFCREELG